MKAFQEESMDLRDYFAAKAMQALITTPPEVPFDENEGLVDEAYYWADLMIEARK
jgi:hypothetical protein